MSKISVTGPKKDMRAAIEELHEAGVMDIEDYSGELETGESFEEGDELSELLVDIRSILSKLPEKESDIETSIPMEDLQETVKEIAEKIESLSEEKEVLNSQRKEVEGKVEFFQKLEEVKLDYSDLNGSQTLDAVVTDITEKEAEEEINPEIEFFEGDELNVVIFERKHTEEVEAAIRRTGNETYAVPDTEYSGSIKEIVSYLERDLGEIKEEKKNIESEIDTLAEKNYTKLENTEEFLTEKVEKAEAPLRFATTDHAFIVKGWVPTEKYSDVSGRLDQLSEGRIHIQEEDVEEDETPPVEHKNNKAVQPFESLTDLVSRPTYNELDPSFVLLLTFPLFFGFMIGDAGYGITSLAVFYGGYKMFPGAKNIFKSLMYASVATIAFGLAFGDAFGYVIFGGHSELAAATGIALFKEIPILWHRAEHLTQVFYISAVIGLVHVNAGYLLGAYNEFVNHGLKEAVLEKGSWMLLQAGAIIAVVQNTNIGLALMGLSLIMLLKGEGVEGVVEIPSLLSNILSYFRIFGVSVAAVSLAQVVNAMANPLLVSGSAFGLVAGVALLMVGHIFNTFIKILEGFLQGIRLHYVEMFDKFYEGGGRKYSPFGGDR